MDLEDFVSTTIGQIVKDVQRAQTEVADSGALINPSLPDAPARSEHPIVRTRGGRIVHLEWIEFDVAITVATEAKGETSGKGRLFVASVEGKVEGSREHTHASRVRFSVPLVLPGQRDPEREGEVQEAKARSEKAQQERQRSSPRYSSRLR